MSETLEQLKILIRQYQISKQDVHDANIAAMVIAHQIDNIWTFNRKDFERFSQIQLLDVPLKSENSADRQTHAGLKL